MGSTVSESTLWTVGHSTRPLEEFLRLLQAHDVDCLVDVRRYPGSRRYPHFNSVPLGEALGPVGIRYVHMPALGGRRRPRPDSVNDGWRNTSFRGYADYMDTDEFQHALKELIAESRARQAAVMCAEAVPWRCHRSLIADALVVRGHEVRHILSSTRWDRHQLTDFARITAGRLTYPSERDPALF
ncbi:MAG TPA: DUF488 domain-containing protein [Nitrospiraceae bacterium]|jgi:uncharacterized protein (DUF488 family)|nr:DUF488 domain-containing protein [Nitrospiraceae bacterium]